MAPLEPIRECILSGTKLFCKHPTRRGMVYYTNMRSYLLLGGLARQLYSLSYKLYDQHKICGIFRL